jgi:hypothetical protein
MKAIIYVSALLLSMSLSGQESHQGFRLFLYEYSKTGKHLIGNAKIDVIINDTTKLSLITDDFGKINFIEAPLGECNIKVQRSNCETLEMKAVEIMKNKIVYLSFNLLCKEYINSLSKKEKKNLGITD